MPSIRPVLIVCSGTHAGLAAALRAHGLGPMVAPDVEQAIRLLRNFRVDVVIGVNIPSAMVRKLAERAPTVVIGGSEIDAWNAGAAAFVEADAVAAVPDIAYRVTRGERQLRAPARSGPLTVRAEPA